MKEHCFIKINPLSSYDFRLVIGYLLLTLPTLLALMLFVVWEDTTLLWIPVPLGILGWTLVLPVTYTLLWPGKERIAVDALSMGFVFMLCLYSSVILFKGTHLTRISEDQAPQRGGERTTQPDPKGRNPEGKYAEEIQKEDL